MPLEQAIGHRRSHQVARCGWGEITSQVAHGNKGCKRCLPAPWPDFARQQRLKGQRSELAAARFSCTSAVQAFPPQWSAARSRTFLLLRLSWT